MEVAPEKWIARISPRPLLIVHGDSDETVEIDHAYRLYQAAGDPKEIRIIPGGEHNLRQNPQAAREVLEWLKKILGD